jgi:hypothetical protein
MMTEKEARTKWCPLARGADRFSAGSVDGYVTQNRLTNGSPDESCHCIGSACMAWRWGPERPFGTVNNRGEPSEEEPPRPAALAPSWNWTPASEDDDGRGYWVEPEDEYFARRVGFCGAFGFPEHRR